MMKRVLKNRLIALLNILTFAVFFSCSEYDNQEGKHQVVDHSKELAQTELLIDNYLQIRKEGFLDSLTGFVHQKERGGEMEQRLSISNKWIMETMRNFKSKKLLHLEVDTVVQIGVVKHAVYSIKYRRNYFNGSIEEDYLVAHDPTTNELGIVGFMVDVFGRAAMEMQFEGADSLWTNTNKVKTE